MTRRRLRWDWRRGLWKEVSIYGRLLNWVLHCPSCGQQALMGMRGTCGNCDHSRHLRLYRLRYPAINAVAGAIREGRIPRLDGRIACVDCGKPATCYDHRSYAEPLKVDPVCRSCNTRRGPALESRAFWIKPHPDTSGKVAASRA